MTTLRILGNDKQAALSTAEDCSCLPELLQASHCSDADKLNQECNLKTGTGQIKLHPGNSNMLQSACDARDLFISLVLVCVILSFLLFCPAPGNAVLLPPFLSSRGMQCTCEKRVHVKVSSTVCESGYYQ